MEVQRSIEAKVYNRAMIANPCRKIIDFQFSRILPENFDINLIVQLNAGVWIIIRE